MGVIMKRRQFLKGSGGAAFLAATGPLLSAKAKAEDLLNPSVAEINIAATSTDFQMLPGNPTHMFSFNGELVKGASSYLTDSSSYLGPMIQVRRGDKIKVNFVNELSEDSIIHWHGLHLPAKQDGHPSYAVGPGKSYQYEFTVDNRAGLYWYHPHPHSRTGYQVYKGLAGLFVVRDDEEEMLNLPSEENEIFLVLQDRHFGPDNQLIYIQSGHDIMMGKVGDRLLVNGQFERKQNVKSEAYRLRLLNGSNALTYRLQWSDKRPLTLIGTDGGLLGEPVERDSILFSPGERLDVIVDLSDIPVGDNLELLSIPIVDGNNVEPFTVYTFNVTESGTKTFTLPTKLCDFEIIPASEAVNKNNPKNFKLLPQQGIGWTIDGLQYEMMTARPKETVKLGDTEIWEFDLTAAGMIHPMHIHGSQFQVVERIHGQFSKDLVFDGGWKDTVAVLPGDRVRVIKRFRDHAGMFLYHCHILEHEDRSMMRNFMVKNPFPF